MTSKSQRLDGGEFARWWEETGEYELSQILYWKWDPIAVSDCFPYSAHEYERYAAEVIAAVSKDRSIDKIAELFGIIENERMGRRGRSPDRRRVLAADILAWLQSSQDRWAEFGPPPVNLRNKIRSLYFSVMCSNRYLVGWRQSHS